MGGDDFVLECGARAIFFAGFSGVEGAAVAALFGFVLRVFFGVDGGGVLGVAEGFGDGVVGGEFDGLGFLRGEGAGDEE